MNADKHGSETGKTLRPRLNAKNGKPQMNADRHGSEKEENIKAAD
jgi:hypothetical protein